MRAKKNKKKKAAYKRGDKLAVFLKGGTIVLMGVVLVAASVLAIKIFSRTFSVRHILVSGNYHLEREDILNTANIKRGESLFKIPFERVNERLIKNAWIKKVAIKKRFPETLVIDIEEAVPRALLNIHKRMYLLDDDGQILEKIKGETTPFLPVIKDINTRNKKGISEAIKLVRALTEKDELLDRDSIEIGLESYGLTARIDGELIKVGYGKYEEKFDRWIELEPEIRKRGVAIKYVDLRFKDSVIVKPLREGKGKKSS